MVWIEVFSAGCPMCEDAIALVEQLAGDAHVTIHDIRNRVAVSEAYRLGVRSLPAVVIDGRLISCEGGGVDEAALRAAGLGEPARVGPCALWGAGSALPHRTPIEDRLHRPSAEKPDLVRL